MNQNLKERAKELFERMHSGESPEEDIEALYQTLMQVQDEQRNEADQVIHALRNLILCFQTQTPHREELTLAEELVQKWDAKTMLLKKGKQ